MEFFQIKNVLCWYALYLCKCDGVVAWMVVSKVCYVHGWLVMNKVYAMYMYFYGRKLCVCIQGPFWSNTMSCSNFKQWAHLFAGKKLVWILFACRQCNASNGNLMPMGHVGGDWRRSMSLSGAVPIKRRSWPRTGCNRMVLSPEKEKEKTGSLPDSAMHCWDMRKTFWWIPFFGSICPVFLEPSSIWVRHVTLCMANPFAIWSGPTHMGLVQATIFVICNGR